MDHTIIFETEVECPPETEALLDRVISATLEAEGVALPCEISVLLTDDAGIHQINREMREVDRPTDVLSFPMFDLEPGQHLEDGEEDPETGLVPLGDMCISLERAAAQAEEFGHSVERELARGFFTLRGGHRVGVAGIAHWAGETQDGWRVVTALNIRIARAVSAPLPEQMTALIDASGSWILVGPPGSGKTTVITHRTKKLIEEEGISPSNILVITFTRAAAMEMQQRFLQLMGGKRLPVSFGTFHAVYFQDRKSVV